MKIIEIQLSYICHDMIFIDIKALKKCVDRKILSLDFYSYVERFYRKKDYRNDFIPLNSFKQLTNKYPKKKLCWCQSGEKFIDCHFNKNLKTPLKENQIFQIQKRKLKGNKCLYDVNFKCDSAPIKSHSISENISLNQISDHKKNVYGLDFGFGGKFSLKKIPISKASTFSGFCNAHDTKLFESFERKDFNKDKKQLFDLCYRALCLEYYHTECIKKFLHSLKLNIDNGRDILEQLQIQMHTNSLISFYERGLNNQKIIKEKLENSFLIDRHEDTLQHFIFELEEGYPKFLSCSCLNLEYNLNGEMIQNLDENTKNTKNIFVNCISFNSKGYFIISWFNENHEYALNIIDSIISDKNEIENKIFSICFLYIHNTYINPTWYENLNPIETLELDCMQKFWSETDQFSPSKIMNNMDSIKVKNYYLYDESAMIS